MPSKGRIQSTGFQELLLELGVNPNGIPFDLRSEVTPVVLVGGTVSFIAAPTPAYRVPDIFTTGLQSNPADGTVLADTGQLPVGAYSVFIIFHAEVNQNFNFEWRDAADAATLYVQRMAVLDSQFGQFSLRLNIENADERFRVRNSGAPGVGINLQSTIMASI